MKERECALHELSEQARDWDRVLSDRESGLRILEAFGNRLRCESGTLWKVDGVLRPAQGDGGCALSCDRAGPLGPRGARDCLCRRSLGSNWSPLNSHSRQRREDCNAMRQSSLRCC